MLRVWLALLASASCRCHCVRSYSVRSYRHLDLLRLHFLALREAQCQHTILIILTLVRNFALLRLEGRMGAALQAAVWDRLLRLPVPFFRRYTSGDLADRSSVIGYILHTLTGSAIFSILSGVFSIFSFLLLFYYSWQLALIAS